MVYELFAVEESVGDEFAGADSGTFVRLVELARVREERRWR